MVVGESDVLGWVGWEWLSGGSQQQSVGGSHGSWQWSCSWDRSDVQARTVGVRVVEWWQLL